MNWNKQFQCNMRDDEYNNSCSISTNTVNCFPHTLLHISWVHSIVAEYCKTDNQKDESRFFSLHLKAIKAEWRERQEEQRSQFCSQYSIEIPIKRAARVNDARHPSSRDERATEPATKLSAHEPSKRQVQQNKENKMSIVPIS